MRVPNLQSALVNKLGIVIPPWNSFFQSFTQAAPAAQPIVSPSPVSFTASQLGNMIILGGAITSITLTRGQANFNLTGQTIIPMGIGDTLTIVYAIAPAINFME